MPTPGTQRTRILLVSQTLDRGGLEEAVLAIAGGLDKQRFEVCVAYFVGGAVATRLAQLPGVQAVHLDISGRLRRLLALTRLTRESGTDILHNHFCWYGLPAAFLARVRRVETVHNLYSWFTPPQRLAYALTCLFAHRLIAVSAAVREYSIQRFPLVRWKRWVTIHNGVETARFRRSGAAALRAEFGVAPGQVVAGFSGRLEEEKGLEHLLDTAAMLLATCPAVRFLVAGTGSRETALRRAAIERGLTNVTFLGYCPDMTRLYPVFDLLAVPSRYEGLPLAMLEAMAEGCPVVAFRVGGIPEAVEDGAQGYLVAPGDTRAFAGRVAQLADDPDLRMRMGKAAVARVGEEFSVAGMITRLQDVYTGLLVEAGR